MSLVTISAEEEFGSFVHLQECPKKKFNDQNCRDGNLGNQVISDRRCRGTVILKRKDMIERKEEIRCQNHGIFQEMNNDDVDDLPDSLQTQIQPGDQECKRKKIVLESLEEMESSIDLDSEIKENIMALKSHILSQESWRSTQNQSSNLTKNSSKKMNNSSNLNYIKNDMKSQLPPYHREYNVATSMDLALENALATIDILRRTLKTYKARVIQLQDQILSDQKNNLIEKQSTKGTSVQTDRIPFFEEKTKIPIRSPSKLIKTSRTHTLQRKNSVTVKTLNGIRKHISSKVQVPTEKVEEEDQSDQINTLRADVTKLESLNQRLKSSYLEEKALREFYHNTIQDLKGKIRVYCRIRPMSELEENMDFECIAKQINDKQVSIKSQRGEKKFKFDKIFRKFEKQEQVYENTKSLIQSTIDGYNVCIFAYGQTGSGKTYTLIGDDEQNDPGIAPRAFNDLFCLIEANQQSCEYKIQTYMLELYNDKFLDLLLDSQESTNSIEIHKDKFGLVCLGGATIKDVTTNKEMMQVFQKGIKNRHIACTKMNNASSRSHCVVGVIVAMKNKLTQIESKGKLSIVDLAGSERISKSGVENSELKEANSINKSLSALGDVISALVTQQAFIPYRNNKLTMLMQDSLGGNAKTVMFVNISPAENNANETLTTLEYATRIRQITNNASKNFDNQMTQKKSAKKEMKKGVKFSLPESS